MATTKQQNWIEGSWVCGKIFYPSGYSEMIQYTFMDCMGKEIRYAKSNLESKVVDATDKIMARLLAV